MDRAAGQPRISVIIPTYNRAEYLKVSLKSLVHQSLPMSDYEVIVVDDGSDDQTPQLCAKFASRLPLRHVRQKHSGISAAKTLGVFSARAPIIFFFDDDDIAHQDLLIEHLRTHEEYPQPNYAVLGYTTWSPSLTLTPVMEHITNLGHNLFSYDHLHDGQILDFTFFWGGRSSCKKSFLAGNGVFSQEMQGSEDIELAFRLSGFGLRVVFNRKAISYMIRPITFDQFCRRCENKGRTDFHFSRLHSHAIVQEYCEVTKAQDQWHYVRRTLDEKVNRIRQLESELPSERDAVRVEEMRLELHSLYQWTFHAFKLKGIMEAKQAYEEAGSLTDSNTGRKSFPREDLDHFESKWSEMPDPLPRQGNVLVVDPTLPMYDRASGSHRLFHIIKALQELGNHVTFISRETLLADQYLPILQEMGIEVYAGDPSAAAAMGNTLIAPEVDLEGILKEKHFDAVILSFWHIAEYYLPLIRRYSPDSLVIVDTVDIHFVRELRESELKQSIGLKELALRNKERELAAYRSADRLWVVTSQDAETIRESVPGVPIDIIPNVHPRVKTLKEYDATRDLIFVGNFYHAPNVDAVQHFCRHIFPLVREQLPDVKLYVIGNNPPETVKALACDHIAVTGYVEDITTYLRNARVSISPLRYGAGMKGKVGEALSWGLPVVTSSIGAEGMGLADGRDALIADTPEEFASAVIRLYNDPNLWRQISANGKSKAESEWSPGAIKARIDAVLAEGRAPAKESLLSIVVLAHNQLEYTKQCLESIRLNTNVPYELILVDNASTDGTQEYIATLQAEWKTSDTTDDRSDWCESVLIIRHDRNLGYAAGNNSGMAAAQGDYVLLLNNDTVVTPGWAERLIRCAESDPALGIVGPMSNCVSGPQKVENISYDQHSLHELEEFSAEWARQNNGRRQDFWRVVGFCMMIKREVIDKIGGLDGRYGIGNFEDDDYSIRAAIAGFRSAIAADCFVHHFGSITFTGEKIDHSRLLLKNWEVFKAKWDLPSSLPYGSPYDLSRVLRQPFAPERHHCSLNTTDQGSASVRRWFAAPKWENTESWQPLIARYIEHYTPSHGVTLSLYAGDHTGSDSQEVYRQVSAFLGHIGMDGNECPDMEITGKLPDETDIHIILSGGALDGELQTRFPNLCTHINDWRQAA